MVDELPKCRGCNRTLDGHPYHTGKPAYIPETGERAQACYYGGHVCSRECDIRACLELEQSMPGHGITQRGVASETMREINLTWGTE